MFKPTPKPKPNFSRTNLSCGDLVKRGVKLAKTKPLSEAHIQATCTEWLELDGWRCVRTDMPHLRGLGVSEPGMPDNLYLRYEKPDAVIPGGGCWHRVMWIEWKKKGGKAAHHQLNWHAEERILGASTLIAGEDFPASIEGFCTWYQASGLQRKSISIPR